MSLSCYCDFEDSDGPEWYPPEDYSTFTRNRRTRCASCNELIDTGATVIVFERFLTDEWGEEKEIPDKYHCERCADLWWSLQELGFECIHYSDNMLHLVKEYAEMVQHGGFE